MTRTEILEVLQAATPDDKILLLSFLTYDGIPVTGDLLDNDVPAWKNIKDYVGDIDNDPVQIPIDYNTQLDGDAETGWYYTIPYIDYSELGDYPDVRVYRSSNTRIWVDYTNILSNDIRIPLPDVTEDGKTQYAYLIIITK